tara:strand:+ start:1114 stop:1341 length:228 start_codon:yes stop_codon:yes gene_type:complete
MSQTVTHTKTKLLVINFAAWTLTNMDQAFFGYTIPSILEELNLPLKGGIVMLTIFRALGFGFSTGLSPITNAYVV